MSDLLQTLVTAAVPYRDINGVARIRNILVDTISCNIFNAPAGAISFATGSVSAPSFTIGGNMGIFKSAPNEISFSANGAVIFSANATQVTIPSVSLANGATVGVAGGSIALLTNVITAIGSNDSLALSARGTGVITAASNVVIGASGGTTALAINTITSVGTNDNITLSANGSGVFMVNAKSNGAIQFTSPFTGSGNSAWITLKQYTNTSTAALVSGTFLDASSTEWRPTVGGHNIGLSAWNPLWFNIGGSACIFGDAFASNAAINRNKVYVVGNLEVVGISRGTKFTIGALDVIQAAAGKVVLGGLTFPTNSNGTSGQVLTGDGAGNVVWNTPAGFTPAYLSVGGSLTEIYTGAGSYPTFPDAILNSGFVAVSSSQFRCVAAGAYLVSYQFTQLSGMTTANITPEVNGSGGPLNGSSGFGASSALSGQFTLSLAANDSFRLLFFAITTNTTSNAYNGGYEVRRLIITRIG